MKLARDLVLSSTAALVALTLGCSGGDSDGSDGVAGAATTPPAQAGSGGAGASPSAGASMGGAPTFGGTAMGGAPTGNGGSNQVTAGTSASGSSSGGASGGSAGAGSSKGGAAGAGGAPNGGSAGKSGDSGGTAGAGTAGTAGAGTAGSGSAPKSSMGCTKATTQALNQWVESKVMTSGAERPYSVRLPTGYDPARAYPVVVLLHGCGGGTNNVPMEKSTGSDAILVRGTGSAASTCWDSSATGKDVAFFDSMVADVKARFCADESRVFVVGYSSGSWLVNQLTCIRADVVRGGATVAGGESSRGMCGGPVARIFLHDTADMDNRIADSERARARQLTQNACDASATPVAVDPSPCTQYQGCKAGYPVTWCQTSGKGHARQDDFAPSAFWNFFKAL